MNFYDVVLNKKSNDKDNNKKDLTKKKRNKKDIKNIIKPTNKKLKLHFDILNPNQDDKLKYLCKLYEFGRIGNVKLYGIMENCGIDMYKYVNKIIQKKSSVPQIIFEEIFKVFKER